MGEDQTIPIFQPWTGDRAGALDALLTRRSCSPKLLTAPGPSEADLAYMAEAAVCAPDYGNLRPWRLLCIQGQARFRLGEVFADAYAARHPGAGDDELQRERGKPLRAPTVIGVAGAMFHDHPKVGVIDQQMSVGAAAMNLLNAAHILGYGAMWLTGESCRDPAIKAALGLDAGDFIAGWIYLGTPTTNPRRAERVAGRDVLRQWTGTTMA